MNSDINDKNIISNIEDSDSIGNTIDSIGKFVAVITIIGAVILFFASTVMGGILLCILIWVKFEKLEKMICSKGFGVGLFTIIGWTIFIIASIIFLFDKANSISDAFFFVLIMLVIWIVGLVLLYKASTSCKLAMPFFLFLLTIGLLFINTNSSSNNNNNNNTNGNNFSGIDSSSTASIGTAAAVSSIVATDTIMDTTNTLSNSSTDTINSSGIVDTTQNTVISNNNIVFDPFNVAENHVEMTETNFEISDDNYNKATVVTLDSDGTGNITSLTEGNIGTISTDGNSISIKDNFGNTISNVDNNTGFVYDENGKPVGIIDNNGDVTTVQDIKTNEIKMVDNGTVWNEQGKIDAHIIKK